MPLKVRAHKINTLACLLITAKERQDVRRYRLVNLNGLDLANTLITVCS